MLAVTQSPNRSIYGKPLIALFYVHRLLYRAVISATRAVRRLFPSSRR
jgi:hypothetical protein